MGVLWHMGLPMPVVIVLVLIVVAIAADTLLARSVAKRMIRKRDHG